METIIPSDVILLFQICLIINDMISLDVLVLVLGVSVRVSVKWIVHIRKI